MDNVSKSTANGIELTRFCRKLKRLDSKSDDFVDKVSNFVKIADKLTN